MKLTNTESFRLVRAEVDGHPYTPPQVTRLGGEVMLAWAFKHPYSLKREGSLVTLEGMGERQVWQLVQ
jgi:hypothetical protein